MDKDTYQKIVRVLEESADTMAKVAGDIAEAFGAEGLGNIPHSEVPDNIKYIGLGEAPDVKDVVKVAYCANMLCFIFFVKGYENGAECYAIRQNTIITHKGQQGLMKIMKMLFDKMLSKEQNESKGKT